MRLRRHLAFPLILAALLSVAMRCPESSVRSATPVIAAFVDMPATLVGEGFGEPGPKRGLLMFDGDRLVWVESTSPRVQSWDDERIVVELPLGRRSGALQIVAPEGRSGAIRVDVFEYDWFDIPPTPFTNAHPLAVAVDASHRVWVNQEFHLEFQKLDPAVGLVEGVAIPRPLGPGPFASTLFADSRTQLSTLGEDIMIDPRDRVWFTQGGGYLYSGNYPNHSRIVCFDPEATGEEEEFHVYNVPGDWNEVIGLAWDPYRERVWFAESGPVTGGKIVSFDPERVPHDNDFDFSESLDHLVCEPGGADDDCFRIYELPESTPQPAHLVVDADGAVWYTSFWGNALARLDPETGEVDRYPLPAPIGQSVPARFVRSGPWQILVAPGGDIAFNEFFDSSVGRFRIAELGNPNCETLNADGRNECIDEILAPEADLVDERVHSIAFDAAGNLWFTQHAPDGAGTRVSLGFVTPDWRHAIRLPPLAWFPGESAAAAGIAIDGDTGDIWFAEFWRERVGRLRRMPD